MYFRSSTCGVQQFDNRNRLNGHLGDVLFSAAAMNFRKLLRFFWDLWLNLACTLLPPPPAVTLLCAVRNDVFNNQRGVTYPACALFTPGLRAPRPALLSHQAHRVFDSSSPPPSPTLTRPLFMRTFFALLVLCATLLTALIACRPSPAPPTSAAPAVAAAPSPRSAACAACHAEAHAAWSGTDHALANRLPTDALNTVLKTFPRPADLATPAASTADPAHSVMILGHAPAWQPLVPAPGGRWQAHELAYDPARRDWFNVFGDEARHPGEWGHWTGRGMNWNTMCAPCHMTGYAPGYDPATDTFKSTWIEQGVGCVSCHGTPTTDHAAPLAPSAPKASLDTFRGDRSLMMQTCAPCHARNETLTGRFQPGDNYHDHYRVTLPTEARTFYPDGQQRDEVFNWTSLLTSRMGHAGVTCLDCHDPHTNKTILPVGNNALCMQCHTAPGRVMAGGAVAPVIEPLAHSRHAEGTAGNQCVSCHMPTTHYMQRSPRHDHGWIKPDPLLTRELGIPNACSKCHQTEGLDWVIARADAWYGPKLDSHQRARTRAVAALQTGSPSAVAPALAVLGREEVPAWRATLLELLAPHAAEPAVRTTLTTALAAPAPLERAAAVRGLTPLPDARPLLRPLLADPVRLVRLDAAWALSAELPADGSQRRELDAYLHLNQDQPAGLARIGMDLANRGRFDEALLKFERAREWDSAQSDINFIIAQLLHAQGKPAQAAAAYLRAATASPDDAESPYRAGLAFAEAGLKTDAEKALRLSLARDPSRDRAWYNLGLLLAADNLLPAALAALAEAEKLAPRIADYPYATATIHLRLGDSTAARAAAQRALAIDPAHIPSRRLLSTP